MTFSEAFWIINLAIGVGAYIFLVEHECGTAWETFISLGASRPS